MVEAGEGELGWCADIRFVDLSMLLPIGIPVVVVPFVLAACCKMAGLALEVKRRKLSQPGKPLWGIRLQVSRLYRSFKHIHDEIAILCAPDMFNEIVQTWTWHLFPLRRYVTGKIRVT